MTHYVCLLVPIKPGGWWFLKWIVILFYKLWLCLHDLRVTHAWLSGPSRTQRYTLNDASHYEEGRAENKVRILETLYKMPGGRVEKADVRTTRRQGVADRSSATGRTQLPLDWNPGFIRGQYDKTAGLSRSADEKHEVRFQLELFHWTNHHVLPHAHRRLALA